MADELTFWRRHVPTGNVYEGKFQPIHHWHIGQAGYIAPKSLEETKARIIETWNRQQPDTWFYSLTPLADVNKRLEELPIDSEGGHCD